MTIEPYRISIEIAAPPGAVFPFFTDPVEMLRWMGDYAVLDATPGGEFTVDINGVPVRGHYLAVEPPHRLVIAWGHAGSDILPPGSSTVEVTLEPSGGGTRVLLVHRDLPPPEAEMHAIGWPHYLSRLGVLAIGGDPGPDPYVDDPPPAPNGPTSPVV